MKTVARPQSPVVTGVCEGKSGGCDGADVRETRFNLHFKSELGNLSRQFAKLLHEALSEAEWKEMLELWDGGTYLSADPTMHACPSHDYIDANEVMAQAFFDITGRAPNMMSDDDVALFNAAWTHAHHTRFDTREHWLKAEWCAGCRELAESDGTLLYVSGMVPVLITPPIGKRLPKTSAESQEFIDTGEWPDA